MDRVERVLSPPIRNLLDRLELGDLAGGRRVRRGSVGQRGAHRVPRGASGRGFDAGTRLFEVGEKLVHRAFDGGQRGEFGVGAFEPARQTQDLLLQRFDGVAAGVGGANRLDPGRQVAHELLERLHIGRGLRDFLFEAGGELRLDVVEATLREFRDLARTAGLVDRLIDLAGQRFEAALDLVEQRRARRVGEQRADIVCGGVKGHVVARRRSRLPVHLFGKRRDLPFDSLDRQRTRGGGGQQITDLLGLVLDMAERRDVDAVEVVELAADGAHVALQSADRVARVDIGERMLEVAHDVFERPHRHVAGGRLARRFDARRQQADRRVQRGGGAPRRELAESLRNAADLGLEAVEIGPRRDFRQLGAVPVGDVAAYRIERRRHRGDLSLHRIARGLVADRRRGDARGDLLPHVLHRRRQRGDLGLQATDRQRRGRRHGHVRLPASSGAVFERPLVIGDIGNRLAQASAGEGGGRGRFDGALRLRGRERRGLHRVETQLRRHRLEDGVQFGLEPLDRLVAAMLRGLAHGACVWRGDARRRIQGATAHRVEPRFQPRQGALDRIVLDAAILQPRFHVGERARQGREHLALVVALVLGGFDDLGKRGERFVGLALGPLRSTIRRVIGVFQQSFGVGGACAGRSALAAKTLGRPFALRAAKPRGSRVAVAIVLERIDIARKGPIAARAALAGKVGVRTAGAGVRFGGAGARREAFELCRHRIDPRLSIEVVFFDAEVGGVVRDHVVKPFTERLALPPRGFAGCLTHVEPDAIDVPGDRLVHRSIRRARSPVLEQTLSKECRHANRARSKRGPFRCRGLSGDAVKIVLRLTDFGTGGANRKLYFEPLCERLPICGDESTAIGGFDDGRQNSLGLSRPTRRTLLHQRYGADLRGQSSDASVL